MTNLTNNCYLNQYLNQGLYGMGGFGMGLGGLGMGMGCGCGKFDWSSFGFGLIMNIGNMLGGGMYGGYGNFGWGGCGYSSYDNGNNSPKTTTKTRQEKIAELDKKIENAKSNVDKAQPTLQKNIDTAQKTLNTYESLYKNYTAAKSKLEGVQSYADSTDPAEKKKYDDAQTELNNAISALEKEGYNINDLDNKKSELEAEVKKAETARDKAIQEYETKIKAEKNEILKTPPLSCSEMNDVLDDADGNWIQRKFQGARGEMMQLIREFRKLKQEYDNIPNDTSNDYEGVSKNCAKKSLIALANRVKGKYAAASDKEREEIDNDKTLQAGWNAIKEWTEWINQKNN